MTESDPDGPSRHVDSQPNPDKLEGWKPRIFQTLRWVSDHPALVVSTATLSFAGANIYVLAGGNLELAQVVVQEQGLATIAVGQLLEVAQTLAALVAGTLLLAPLLKRVAAIQWLSTAAAWTASLMGLSVVLLVFPRSSAVATLGMAGLVAVSFVGFATSRRRAKRRSKNAGGLTSTSTDQDPGPREVAAFQVMILLAPVMLFGAIFDSDPWLPRERVVVDGGRSATVYVLRADGGEVVAVEAESRRLLRIPPAKIKSRELCTWRPDGASDGPLVALTPGAKVPVCPRES